MALQATPGAQAEEPGRGSRGPVRAGHGLARGQPEAVSRTIKVEYVFMPYNSFADLTRTSLHLQSSSTDVTGAYGVSRAVHTNGNLTTAINPTVTGPVTYSGSASGSFGTSWGGDGRARAGGPAPQVSAESLTARCISQAMATWD